MKTSPKAWRSSGSSATVPGVTPHVPVLVKEILEIFQPKAGDRLLDLTLGTGGHTRAYLAAAGPSATAVGLDADPVAIASAQQRLVKYAGQVTYYNANFAHLNNAVLGGGIVTGERSFKNQPPFTHILLDLGLGSHQLAQPERGFSFQSSGPLTMQYGPLSDLPPSQLPALDHLTKYLGRYPNAGDIINEMAEADIEKLLRLYGEERYVGRIAHALKKNPRPSTTAQAAARIVAAVPANYEQGRIHPATRTFQALRLAVNRELEALAAALPQAVAWLSPAGILAVISFHSLEDRIVKHFLRQEKKLEGITKKPIRASGEEIRSNPRARSAKLRAARRLSEP